MLLTTGVLGASGVSEKIKKAVSGELKKKSKGGFERRKSMRGVLFAFLGSGFAHIFKQIVSIRVKTLGASFANALSEGKNLQTKVSRQWPDCYPGVGLMWPGIKIRCPVNK